MAINDYYAFFESDTLAPNAFNSPQIANDCIVARCVRRGVTCGYRKLKSRISTSCATWKSDSKKPRGQSIADYTSVAYDGGIVDEIDAMIDELCRIRERC